MAVERVELFPTGALGVTDPARLGAFGAMVVTALFTLLYVYRRRAYILHWVSAWVLLTAALSVAARDTQQAPVALLMLGFSRFLSFTAILAIASSPLTFRNRRWLDRRYLLGLARRSWAGVSPRHSCSIRRWPWYWRMSWRPRCSWQGASLFSEC